MRCAPCPHNAVLLAHPLPSPYGRGGNFARPAMSAAVSIALWAGAGLTISALLAAITVALNRRMRIVDPVKGIHFDKVGLRRWLVDYEIALRRRLDQT
jgi:hypothetical protein